MSPKMDKHDFEDEKKCSLNYKAFILYISIYIYNQTEN